MPIIATLLSGATPYVLALLLALAAAGGSYGLYERSLAADARAATAAQSATINEQQATITADAEAYAALLRIKELDETVIAHTANAAASVRSALTIAETKVTHAKVPADCQSADARDAAVVDGLRRIIAAAPAAGANQGGQGAASGDAARLPAAAGDPANAQEP
jgi:hypothetical protein